MTESIKILFVEDVLPDNEIIWRQIKKENIQFTNMLVETEADYIDALGSFKPDIIISDYSLPQFDGMRALKIRNELLPLTPFILVTGSINESVAVNCMKAGADDYIIKQNLSRLVEAIKSALKKKEIIQLKRKAENALLEVENKNKLITYSIKYAKSIQSAVLKASQNLSEYFSDQFALILPKDIVSGDFYWSAKINGRYLIGVFDCTGHGVPGAFMSLLFITFLNETVNSGHILEPHLILDRLREKVIDALEQKGVTMEVHDGMDAVILSYDPEDKIIHFSGALSKMYLIRNDKILEFRGDPMSVSYSDVMKNFSLQEIKIQRNDVVFLFTDGYRDQFGGPFGKKFGARNFKKILLENYKKPMETQKQILYDAHLEWKKGKSEQIDDISVLGIRF